MEARPRSFEEVSVVVKVLRGLSLCVAGVDALQLLLLEGDFEGRYLLVGVVMAGGLWLYGAIPRADPRAWRVYLPLTGMGLPLFPLGTLVNGVALYLLFRSETREWLWPPSARPAPAHAASPAGAGTRPTPALPFEKVFGFVLPVLAVAAFAGVYPTRDRRLQRAIDQHQVGTLKLMLFLGADPNRASPSGEAPLMRAMSSLRFLGTAEMVEPLLKRGANPNVKNRFGNTALIEAAKAFRPDTRTVKLLLDHGADVNARDPSGNTVLMCAIEQARVVDNTEVAKLLLAGNPDLIARDRFGQTALTKAERLRCRDLAALLRAAGAR